MVDKKSIEFLPQTFRTNTNRRFLNATVDQLIQEPNMGRIYGYVGRQDLSPTYLANDAYVQELDSYSQYYQLEPGLVINKRVVGTDTFKKTSAYSYIDLLNGITSEGGITNDHSRLFAQEYYNYEGFIDLDKLINYGKYYWLPNGPQTLEVNGGGLSLEKTFKITRPLDNDVVQTERINRNVGAVGFSVDAFPRKSNPTITLVRGGTYTFNVSQPGHPFYIQTEPGLAEGSSYQENILRRQIFGLSNNGAEVGNLLFTVPSATAQTFFEKLPVFDTVDLITDIPFNKLQNAPYSPFMLENSIDGLKSFTTKTIVLTDKTDEFWYSPDNYDDPNIPYDKDPFDRGLVVPKDKRRGIWQISNDEGKIKLTYVKDWPANTKLFVKEGREYGHLYVFKDYQLEIFKQPNLTANLSTLYYQDGVDANVYGEIKLIDPDPTTTLNVEDILGQQEYTSPNGVVFTSGLKIKFTGLIVPENYTNKEYVVEGVGKSITLTEWESLLTPDPNNPNLGDGFGAPGETYDELNYDFSLNAPIRKDYILINRASVDGNAWSRTNRWFHEDVIRYTSTFLNPNAAVELDNNFRGIRPIVEFDSNLKLFNHQEKFIGAVTVIDNYITDVANQVEGRSPYVLVYPTRGTTVTKKTNENSIVNSRALYFDFVSDISTDMRIVGVNIQPNTVVESIDYENKIVYINKALVNDTPSGSEFTFNGEYVSDDVPLEDGTKVIFLKEKYANVRNKIYQVQNILPHSDDPVLKSTVAFSNTNSYLLRVAVVDDLYVNMKVVGDNVPENSVIMSIDYDTNTVTINNPLSGDVSVGTVIQFSNTVPQIHLMPLHEMSQNEGIVAVSGASRQNSVYWWNNNNWKLAQQKFSLNQSPLFDVFNLDGISWGDTEYYPSSTFQGSKLFGYKEGTGTRDSELGFALTYRNIGNIGDIVFENYYDTDSFHFNYQNKDQVLEVNKGYAHEIVADGFKLKNNWVKVADLSKQYIEKRFVATQNKKNNWPINVEFVNSFNEKNIFVYVNQKEINRDSFVLYAINGVSELVLTNDLVENDVLVVRIAGKPINTKENYTVPSNLADNSENNIFTTLTLGQIRNHLEKIAVNSLAFRGQASGSNNFRDIDYKVIPGRILQHSAGVHIAQLMFNNESTNIIKSIDFSRRSYSRFKDRFYFLVNTLEFPDPTNARECVDIILNEINVNASSEQSFFYTDMLPCGINNYVLNEYRVYDTNYRTFNLVYTYNVLEPSFQGVLIYLNNEQLIIGRDYEVTGNNIVLNGDLILNIDDLISVYEYPDTTGCMIPATPTKLGLYPKYTPAIELDNSYIAKEYYVIQGHDGSRTVAYSETADIEDYRDHIILEFEKRIYNNINVEFTNDPGLSYTSVEPGKFRQTEYSIDEWTQLLSGSFLSWAGTNNVNIFTNTNIYQNDPFSFNYSQGFDRIDNEPLPGYWRGIYKYFYDTDRPHTHPWEMLGITEKPDWWEVRYGPAPYSSGNEVLWNDLSLGLVYQRGTDSYIDSRYARPGLTNIIPVDTHGNLLPPISFAVTNWNQQTAGANWRFGDQSPQETAWRRSSDYPFAVQIAWALARPAQYCALSLNRRDLIRVTGLDQIINRRTSNRYVDLQITNADQSVPGSNVWIRDRLADFSLDINENFNDVFKYYSLNLIYKTGGFTDKQYLQVIAEQASPNSTNSGVLVPQENYSVVLTKSAPVGIAVYSAVIVEKTSSGFTVRGFDNTRPYFTIIPRVYNNNFYTVKVSNTAAVIYNDSANTIQTIPYGTLFTNKQQIVDFLISYGKYLTSQGFEFVDTTVVDTIPAVSDWTLAVKEYLFWLEQGWDINTVISLTPAGTKVNFNGGFGLVDELTNSFTGSRVIDSSGNVLKAKDYTTYRSGTAFELIIRDQTKGIHLVDMTVVQYEHTVVFDNTTVFNDVIYEPSLGNRQYRMKMNGFKTRDWDGSLYAPGFLINHVPVDTWAPMQDYYKGEIVEYKNLYYTAKQFIPGTPKFESNGWYQIESTLFGRQLLPNMAFNAQQFENFYDVDTFDVNRYADLKGRNSTGFVPRDYLSNMGLDTISQHKFYLGMIREKGTQAAVNAFLRAKLPYLSNEVKIDEQWAIRLGGYGGIDQRFDLEVSLANAKVYNGAYIVEFLDKTDRKDNRWNTFRPDELLIKPSVYDKHVFAQTEPYAKIVPTTGHVIASDVDVTVFDIQKIYNLSGIANSLGEGNRIWVAADKKNDWNVYRLTADDNVNIINAAVVGTEIEFTTDKPHNLRINDNVMIKRGTVSGAGKDLSGFYRVSNQKDKSFRVPVYPNAPTATGSMKAKLFRLKSVRFATRSQFAYQSPSRGWQQFDQVYLDGLNNNWQVLVNNPSWSAGQTLTPVFALESDNFGSGIDVKATQDTMVVGAPVKDTTGYVYVYKQTGDNTWNIIDGVKPTDAHAQGFGHSIKYSNLDLVTIGAPDSNSGSGACYVMTTTSNRVGIKQVIYHNTLSAGAKFGYSVAASTDGKWIAVGAPGDNTVYLYQYTPSQQVVTYPGDGTNATFLFPSTAINQNLLAGDLIVRINNVDQIPAVDYNLSQDKYVVFEIAPAVGQTVEIIYNLVEQTASYTTDGIANLFEFPVSAIGKGYVETDVFVKLDGAMQVPYVDYIVNSNRYVIFNSLPAADQTVEITYQPWYQLVDTITNAEASGAFGHSISMSADGSQIVIGAPELNITNNSVVYNQMGAVYVYERGIETFVADGIGLTYTLSDQPQFETVIVNGEITNNYTLGSYSLTLGVLPSKDSLVTIETNKFTLIEKKQALTYQSMMKFGSKVLICANTCSIYIGAPGYNQKNYSNGAVYRFVNTGRLYGSVVSQVNNATITAGTSLRINGVKVTFTGTTISSAAADINAANIPGVSASVLNRTNLKIQSDSAIAYNKLILNVVTGQTTLADLKIGVFDYYQVIYSNTDQSTTDFGHSLALSSDASKLLIGASLATNRKNITFDRGRTTFDIKTTRIQTVFYRSGNAYLYEYQADPNETSVEHGNFTFAQSFANQSLSTDDMFGTGLALTKNWLFITALNSKNNAGAIYTHYNKTAASNWQVLREKPVETDSRKIERVYIYDDNKKTLVADLPVIDPEHGLPIPAAPEQIRYTVNYDPAIYNRTPNTYSFAVDDRNAWAEEHVGELWWDTNLIKYTEWNQGDLLNKFNNWGLAFPNSYIAVYEWIESDFAPSQYATKNPTTPPLYTVNDVYTTRVKVDPLTLQQQTKYYFWIKNNNQNDSLKRRDSALALQNLIANPRNINIPFAAVISSNAIALFNCKDIVNADSLLHLQVKKSLNVNVIHEEWGMFDDGSDLGVAQEFLDRLNDSMAGEDAQGRTVPDGNLTVKERYGLNIRPRQTTFADRFAARAIWVENVNAALIQYPISILRDISNLQAYEPLPVVDNRRRSMEYYDSNSIYFTVDFDADLGYINNTFYNFRDADGPGDRVLVINDSVTGGWTIREHIVDPADSTKTIWEIVRVQTYDLRTYWTYTDWYASGFNVSTPVAKILGYEYEIANSNPQIGDVIKITNSNDGQWKLILVKENSLELIGQQNATIQFNTKLYDNLAAGFGVDSTSFEVTSFARDASLEFRKIFNTINNEILTKELRTDYKSVIGTMIDTIANQFKQNDWLLKTSLLNVKHNVRSLDQIPVYVKQPENIITGFIQEIKPYHSKIKQYISSYNKTDLAGFDATDFDLPAYYNATINKYRQPQLGNPVDDVVIDNIIYKPWIDNHTYGIEYIDIDQPGTNYNNATQVKIVGDGTGATADVFVRGGAVYDIVVTNPGRGYTHAEVHIIGIGSGAKAYAKLGYGTARTFKTTVKFDRFTYDKTIKEWKPNTTYNISDLILYNKVVYRVGIDVLSNTTAITTITTGNIFETNNLIELVIRAWQPNSLYQKNTIIVYDNQAYVALTDFRTGRYFEYNPDVEVTNSVDWQANTFYAQNTVLSYAGASYVAADAFTSAPVFTDFVATTWKEWAPVTEYMKDEIVRYNSVKYTVTATFTSGTVFSTDNLTVLYENNVYRIFDIAKYPGGYFDDAANRVWAWYYPLSGMPGRDIAQVMTGIDYPGVNVKGPQFDQAPGFGFGLYEQITYDTRTYDENGLVDIYGDQAIDSEYHSLYTDTQLGLRPEDILTDGAAYVDVYSSHAPEELVPGHMFDSLNIKVTTLANVIEQGAPEIVCVATYADDIQTKFYFDPVRTGTALPKGNIETIFVYNDVNGPRFEGEHFDINWQDQYIEFYVPPLIPSSVFIYMVGNSGQNVIVNEEFIANGAQTEFEIPEFTLNKVQQAYVKVNNQISTAYSLLHPTNITEWLPGAMYEVDDYVSYNGFTYRVIADFQSADTFSRDNLVAADRIIVRFDNAPAAGARVQVNLYDFALPKQAYSHIVTTQSTVPVGYVPGAFGYVVDLDEPIGYILPSEANIRVTLNNLDLEPSDQAYYVGDGVTKTFSLPTFRNVDNVNAITDDDIKVVVNGVQKAKIQDYAINRNGVDIPTITFVNAPADNTKIVVSNRYNAAYIVLNENQVAIKSSIAVQPGDKITVTIYTNHDQYDTNVQVFSGSVTSTASVDLGFDEIGFDIQGFEDEKTNLVQAPVYTLTRPVNNSTNLIVWLNGIELTQYYDYVLVNPTTLRIDPVFGITSTDVIWIQHISEATRQQNIEFRIFKGVTETYEYLGISNSTTTRLTQDLMIDDEYIYVENVLALSQPDPQNARPGICFINGERITFYIIDLVNSRLGQIRRATNGTGAPDVHMVGTKVTDAGFKVEIPNSRDSYRPAGVVDTVSKSGIDINIDSKSIDIADTSGIVVGMIITGTYIQEGTKVIGIEPNTSIRINKPITANLTNTTLKFTGIIPGTSTILVSSTGSTVTVPAGDLIRTGQIWYDQGIGSATNGLGLVAANTAQAKFLKAL